MSKKIVEIIQEKINEKLVKENELKNYKINVYSEEEEQEDGFVFNVIYLKLNKGHLNVGMEIEPESTIQEIIDMALKGVRRIERDQIEKELILKHLGKFHD